MAAKKKPMPAPGSSSRGIKYDRQGISTAAPMRSPRGDIRKGVDPYQGAANTRFNINRTRAENAKKAAKKKASAAKGAKGKR